MYYVQLCIFLCYFNEKKGTKESYGQRGLVKRGVIMNRTYMLILQYTAAFIAHYSVLLLLHKPLSSTFLMIHNFSPTIHCYITCAVVNMSLILEVETDIFPMELTVFHQFNRFLSCSFWVLSIFYPQFKEFILSLLFLARLNNLRISHLTLVLSCCIVNAWIFATVIYCTFFLTADLLLQDLKS